MLRIVNWVARSLGFAAEGVLTFLNPARGAAGEPVPFALPVQITGYCLLGLGLLAWALLETHPLARYRARGLPVVLGVMVVATGFAAAAGGGGASMIAFGFVAAMVAGSDTSLLTSLAITGAGVLAIEVSGLAFGAGFGVLAGLPVLVLCGEVIGRNRGAYRIQAEQAAQLLAQRDRLQAEQRRGDLLDERARIAREIHDVLAHSLGALGIQIQAARAVLTDTGDVARAQEILAGAQRMASDGLEDTRRAVHALRADTPPLDQELRRVSDTHAQRYHVRASFDTAGAAAPLPPDARVALLRTAQESLVNAAKHAAGQPVAVRLDYTGAGVRLTVRNDLPPGAAAAGTEPASTEAAGTAAPPGMSTVNGGYGLTGMAERLRLLDGTLQAGRRGDQWVVIAALPRARLPRLSHPDSPQPENPEPEDSEPENGPRPESRVS